MDLSMLTQIWRNSAKNYVLLERTQFLSHLNPYSERTWGSLLRKVRTALVDSNVPHVFWTYCMSQAAMVCSALLGEKGKSTYEMAWGKPFDYKTLHVWGCKVYYLVPEHERR